MVLRMRGEGVAAADLAAAAARLCLPPPSAAVAAWQVMIVGSVDQGRLERALEPPTVACLEWHDGVGDVPVSMSAVERRDGLYLSLTTATAYRLQPAAVFRQAAARRFTLSAEVGDALELAVHEALANAVLHGNLGLDDMPKDDLDQLAAFWTAIEDRLGTPALAARRVHVWAEPTGRGLAVTVADEGAGYAAERPRQVDPERKSGRGLSIIRGLATRVVTSDGGRRITMEFIP